MNLGRWGEQQASNFLETKGIQVLARNIRTPYGEIDLLAKEGDVWVFVEVKTRSSKSFGYPEEAVTSLKVGHMVESAESYLQQNELVGIDWRIDVIAILKRQDGSAEIVQFENAVGQ